MDLNVAKMNGLDTVTGSQATCYATIEGRRWNMMEATKIEATYELKTKEVPVLGKLQPDTKPGGIKFSGSMTVHYVSSKFRELLKKYKDTGRIVPFDIQLTNEDESTSLGRQTVILKNCFVTKGTLATFDVEAEFLDESVDFSYDDFELPESFNELEGM